MTISGVNAANSAAAKATTANSSTSPTSSTSFAQTLSASMTKKPSHYFSGQIGIDLDSRGHPSTVSYFDLQGNKLTTSTFSAEAILRNTKKFGIPLTDLKSIGAQLDADQVGYRPYELYRGTGSDHGINFEDLINGGLGTAYDWRKDSNVHLKGEFAAEQLARTKSFADELGICKNSSVTQEKGIDPNYFAPLQTNSEGVPRPFVAYSGQVASWHTSVTTALENRVNYGGAVLTPSATERPVPGNVTADSSSLVNQTPTNQNSALKQLIALINSYQR